MVIDKSDRQKCLSDFFVVTDSDGFTWSEAVTKRKSTN